MIYITLLVWSAFLAIIADAYIQYFLPRLIDEVYANFKLLFPEFTPVLSNQQKLEKSHIKLKPYVSVYWLIALFYVVQIGFFYSFQSLSLSLWFSFFFTLSIIIFILDYLYQFIPIALCQLLFGLILFGDYFHLLPFSIAESVLSGSIGFIVFYILYYVAKWLYGQEALGRGDYWLVFALAGGIPWQKLSLFIFLACCLALFYYFILFCMRKRKAYIPFGPFLILSSYFFLFYYLLGS